MTVLRARGFHNFCQGLYVKMSGSFFEIIHAGIYFANLCIGCEVLPPFRRLHRSLGNHSFLHATLNIERLPRVEESPLQATAGPAAEGAIKRRRRETHSPPPERGRSRAAGRGAAPPPGSQKPPVSREVAEAGRVIGTRRLTASLRERQLKRRSEPGAAGEDSLGRRGGSGPVHSEVTGEVKETLPEARISAAWRRRGAEDIERPSAGSADQLMRSSMVQSPARRTEESDARRHQGAMIVWIIGHSFIFWAQKRAEFRKYGTRDFAACNHLRSYKYYSETILKPEAFVGFPTSTYSAFSSGSGFPCPSGGCPLMGHFADSYKGASGQKFFLNTGDSSSFARWRYKVTIQVAGSLNVQGFFHVSLFGPNGNTRQYQIYSGYINTGNSYTAYIDVETDVGPLNRVKFIWNNNVINPLFPTIGASSATVQYGKNGATYRFCGSGTVREEVLQTLNPC